MHDEPPYTHPSSRTPTEGLLAAALAGLLGACGPASSPKVTSTQVVASLSLEEFDSRCAKREGVTQIHPHCGGANSCKGFSYDSDTDQLVEHTCKGYNTCAGMSCVELQKDRGRKGKDLYAEECASCHGDDGRFAIFVEPTADKAAERKRFEAASVIEQASAVAFGVPATNSAELHLPPMPAIYDELSREEILRVVAFADALPITVDNSGLLPKSP